MTRLHPFLLLALASGSPALGDEGFWLLNDFPSAKVQAAHGFGPSQQWLDRVRLGAVRLNGCSGELRVHARPGDDQPPLRPRAASQHLSTARDDYLGGGLLREDPEGRASLRPTSRPTSWWRSPTSPSASAGAPRGRRAEAFADGAARPESARIEKELRHRGQGRGCDVVSLFHGGKYHLYKYRRFQDVRLVFAPEFAMAAFGGYADNFEFPRYDFDVGVPARLRERHAGRRRRTHFQWAPAPAAEGDLVFVAGNPGGTERARPSSSWRFQRDVVLPWVLVRLAELRGSCSSSRQEAPSTSASAAARIRTVENALKALAGRRGWLADPANFERKRREDAELRAAVRKDPAKEARFGGAWTGIAQAMQAERALFVRHPLAESQSGVPSDLFEYARLAGARARRSGPSPRRAAARVRRCAPARAGEQAASPGAGVPLAGASAGHLRAPEHAGHARPGRPAGAGGDREAQSPRRVARRGWWRALTSTTRRCAMRSGRAERRRWRRRRTR